MQEYHVFRDGVKWYFTLDGVRSEPFESRDAAKGGGQKAVIEKRKKDRDAKFGKVKKEDPEG